MKTKQTIAEELQGHLNRSGGHVSISAITDATFWDMCRASQLMLSAETFKEWDHAASMWFWSTLLYMSALTGEF